MFDRTYEQLQKRQAQADQKISKLQRQKSQAIQQRLRQLNEQLSKISYGNQQYNRNVNETRLKFEQFKAKNKALYKSIFQGARELDLRKKDLIEDIQGLNRPDNQNY